MMNFVLSIVMDIFFIMTIHVFYRTVLETRWREEWKLAMGWLVYLILWNLISIVAFQYQLVVGAGCALLNFLAVLIFYRGTIRTKVLYLFVILVTGFLAEAIIGIIFILELGSDSLGQMTEQMALMGSAMSKLVWFMLIRVVLLIAGHMKQLHVGKLDWAEIFVVPILSIVIICALTFNKHTESENVLVITVSSLFVINIVTFYLYQRIQSQAIYRAEKQILQQQNDYYTAQYLDIERQWNHARKLRHDMGNQYILEMNYLRQQDYKQLLELYENKIGELTNANAVINTGNIGIDSIVNYKVEYAREHQIDIRYETKLRDQITIPNEDLNVVIGNLLDNAIEAVSQLEQERVIHLKLSSDASALLVRVENKYVGQKEQNEEGVYLTTKKETLYHGIGLGAVKAIVKRYNGTMETQDNDQIFRVEVMLYMNRC